MEKKRIAVLGAGNMGPPCCGDPGLGLGHAREADRLASQGGEGRGSRARSSASGSWPRTSRRRGRPTSSSSPSSRRSWRRAAPRSRRRSRASGSSSRSRPAFRPRASRRSSATGSRSCARCRTSRPSCVSPPPCSARAGTPRRPGWREARKIFESIGLVVELPEYQLDAVTGSLRQRPDVRLPDRRRPLGRRRARRPLAGRGRGADGADGARRGEDGRGPEDPSGRA